MQIDGKILVGGYFSSYNGITQKGIFRLNSDGTQDDSFNVGTGFGTGIDKISLLSDGKIFCGGYISTTFNASTESKYLRLLGW